MKKYTLHLNSRRCIGCQGCLVHCKTNKELPVGPMLCEIDHSPLQPAGRIPKTEFVFTTCRHCDDPLCVPACPTGAMVQREDGIVYIAAEQCIGCMACRTVCPWQIPVHNPETGIAAKCDMCMDRIDAGLQPACVTKCTTHALKLMVVQPA